MIENKYYNLMTKYCTDDILSKWTGFSARFHSIGQVRIVNTGMVSSGKSSLYNALMDSIESEIFPTGASRKTINVHEEQMMPQVVLVDTPGIDVQVEDDDLAYSSVVGADMILLIHNVKTGDLTRSEIEWMNKMIETMDIKDLAKKLVFICSWVDERDKDPDYVDLIKKLKNMLSDTLGADIPFFEISAKRYFNGMRNSKKTLIAKSNIGVLRLFIENSSKSILSEKNTDILKEKKELIKQTKTQLSAKERDLKSHIDEIKKSSENFYQYKKDIWKENLQIFKDSKKDLLEKKKSLNSLNEFDNEFDDTMDQSYRSILSAIEAAGKSLSSFGEVDDEEDLNDYYSDLWKK